MNLDDRIALFENAFHDGGGDDVLGGAQLNFLQATFDGRTEPVAPPEGVDLLEIAWAFESLGVESWRSGAVEARLATIFGRAFRIRSSLWTTGSDRSLTNLWLLTISGVAAQRQPELRHLLMQFDWSEQFGEPPDEWDKRVLWEAVRAMSLLARKGRGWTDIDGALEALRALSGLQAQAQEEYLSSEDGDTDNPASRARRRILGLYHLAEALAVLGRYLRTGEPESIATTLERHGEHCRYLLGGVDDFDLEQIGSTVELALVAMARASIWFNTSRLSQAAREFAQRMVDEGRREPVAELWWSQREALSQSLLDPYKAAVGVQMPTSAGKTLLAEFAIVQSLALNPDATVAYVVPTRALVNQMTRRLRADLEGGAIGGREPRIESAVPVFELDPTEDLLLRRKPDVLVTTPEKLDLLVRSGHAAVAQLALVVVDEAHHISEPTRGPRLELLLATLKRERGARCHFLLLTPFLPNARELAEWLGDADHVAIMLDWKPSEQLRALGKWRKRQGRFYDVLKLLPSATQPHVWQDQELELGTARTDRTARSRPGISASIAATLSAAGERGGVLILTRGPGTAEDRASDVVAAAGGQLVPTAPDGAQLVEATALYIASELGEDYPLVDAIRQGIAFHHAGLPPEVRSLVEVLLERGSVRVVAGTSTLAQGVNFPLSSVVIETLSVPQGRGRPYRALQYSEFWNIAGRAGRALKDSVGLVVWPATSAAEEKTFREYLAGEAAEVVSALADVLAGLGDADTQYNLALVRSQPSLSHFLQYLTHALRVAGYEQATAEVEEILRSSLVFHRLRREHRDAAEQLVRWSRRFLASTRNRPLLDVADVTGLSLPSVGLLAGKASPTLRDPEFWRPDHLFGQDLGPLTDVVALIGELPEMSLGLTDEAGGMNAHRVAGILRDWVVGTTLPEIADNWYTEKSGAKALLEVGRYLFRELTGQLPWGLGALQLISLGREITDEAGREARRTPAMAYYGVADANALTLRMVGVPRAAASTLGEGAPEFESFQEARTWVNDKPEEAWERAGADRGLSGEVLRTVWSEVGGSSA